MKIDTKSYYIGAGVGVVALLISEKITPIIIDKVDKFNEKRYFNKIKTMCERYINELEILKELKVSKEEKDKITKVQFEILCCNLSISKVHLQSEKDISNYAKIKIYKTCRDVVKNIFNKNKL